MKLLTLDEAKKALQIRFGDDAETFPDHFGELVPVPASLEQARSVSDAIQALTGCSCSVPLLALLKTWGFNRLNVANFSFGRKGALAERLVEHNRSDAAMAWWEGAYNQRPRTRLFIAQNDPYVLLLDALDGSVWAYVDAQGADTAVKVAPQLDIWIRVLISIQLQTRDAVNTPLLMNSVMNEVGLDCNTQFWALQIAQWTQEN